MPDLSKRSPLKSPPPPPQVRLGMQIPDPRSNAQMAHNELSCHGQLGLIMLDPNKKTHKSASNPYPQRGPFDFHVRPPEVQTVPPNEVLTGIRSGPPGASHEIPTDPRKAYSNTRLHLSRYPRHPTISGMQVYRVHKYVQPPATDVE